MGPQKMLLRASTCLIDIVMPVSSSPRLLGDCFSATHAHLYLDARAEPVDDRHEAINGEPSEVRVADAREVGRRNACAPVRPPHGQVFPIERLNDFGGQDGLELLRVRVVVPEVAEYIAASPL